MDQVRDYEIDLNRQSGEQDAQVIKEDNVGDNDESDKDLVKDAPEQDHEEKETPHDAEPESDEVIADDSHDNKTFSKAQVDQIVKERLARERRKFERDREYAYAPPHAVAPQGNDYGYNQPSQQPMHQQAPAATYTPHPAPPHLTPDQQEAWNVQQLVRQLAAEEASKIVSSQKAEFQQQLNAEKFAEEDRKSQSFYQEMKKSVDEDAFDDFTHDVRQMGRKFGPREQNTMATLLDLAQKINDPKILLDIHKRNPEEFQRLATMPPHMQAVKLGEYRGRSLAPERKIVSSAPSPITEVKSKSTSSYRPSGDDNTADLVAHKLKSRR